MDDALYARLKQELPPKGISKFIEDAVRARLRPSKEELAVAYMTAARESWRTRLASEWDAVDVDTWPA
jgi:hypothetical protein